MSVTPPVSYPGVYIQELPSTVHTITAVATSITAFVGYTIRGPENKATEVLSWSDFERLFGGLASDSELSYAVKQFFDNGGTTAYVVRVGKDNGTIGEIQLGDESSSPVLALTVDALSKGAWANQLIVDIDYGNVSDKNSFNVTITDMGTGTVETFDNVTIDSTSTRFVTAIINDPDNGSNLITVKSVGNSRPAQTGTTGSDLAPTQQALSTLLSKKVTNGDVDYQFTVTDGTGTNTITTASSPGPLVPLIPNQTFPPASIMGLCSLLQIKANQALQTALANGTWQLEGAEIQCVPSDTGLGIRVTMAADGDQDLQITFTSTNDFLNLKTLSPNAPQANVGHYWFGSSHSSGFAQEKAISQGADGTTLPTANGLSPPGNGGLIGDPSQFTGIYALEKVDLFNILCIPDLTRAASGNPRQSDLDPTGFINENAILSAAMPYCEKRRAFLLVDCPPQVYDVQSAVDWFSGALGTHDSNGAAYFPRIKISDPLNNNSLRTFAPCGVIAGLYAQTDANRGVWKAPAGTEATLNGVQGLVYNLTDPENGVLNPLGLNCLRIFPVYGDVCWGARTLAGNDQMASQWKYVPVRRFALFLEESLYRGTKWVVFEPNAEPLWAQIRLSVGAFMQDLFRQGAFQGQTPQQAYFVKCDDETTTQTDIDNGIVNILVGFAPLKPAEFVVIKISQISGQIPT
jgi:phage tail sheath protein FI